MESSQIYIIISLVVLAIIFIIQLLTKKDKKKKQLTTLAGFAWGFILAGIIFNNSRLIAYGLIGIGVILAIIDAIKKLKTGK